MKPKKTLNLFKELRSSSNNDGNSNKNGKKATGLE